jgi:hypothetical protein
MEQYWDDGTPRQIVNLARQCDRHCPTLVARTSIQGKAGKAMTGRLYYKFIYISIK